MPLRGNPLKTNFERKFILHPWRRARRVVGPALDLVYVLLRSTPLNSLARLRTVVLPVHAARRVVVLAAGEKWEPSILNELKAADIVVCQISRNYLASDACMAELNAAIERSNSKEAVVVAYVLNDCRWKDEKRLKEFQLLPTDGKPLSDWSDINKYWHAVTEGIQKAIKKFQAEKKSRPGRMGMEN